MEPRNYLANADTNPPTKPAGQSHGYPRSGVPGVSDATTPGPHWFYKIGEELRAVITAAGLSPDDASLGQVRQALEKLFASDDHDHPEAVSKTDLCGSIAAWPTADPPDGWLECNGATISRTRYAGLFSVIGTTFGDGGGSTRFPIPERGSTKFRIPDLRGEFIRGWDHGRGKDTSRSLGTFQKPSAHFIEDGNEGGGLATGYTPVPVGDTRINVGIRELGYDEISPNDYSTLPFYLVHPGSCWHPVNRGLSKDPNWFNHRTHVYNKNPGYFGASRPSNVAMMFCIKY